MFVPSNPDAGGVLPTIDLAGRASCLPDFHERDAPNALSRDVIDRSKPLASRDTAENKNQWLMDAATAEARVEYVSLVEDAIARARHDRSEASVNKVSAAVIFLATSEHSASRTSATIFGEHTGQVTDCRAVVIEILCA